MEPVHQRIEKIRKEKGVTKTHIANKCGKSVAWYSGISTGRRKPNIESVQQIADALETDVRNFFGDKLSVTLKSNTCSRTTDCHEVQ